MSSANDQFYARLPVQQTQLGRLLGNDKLFADVPADWHVIITDIIGSTKAVMNGQHETVNQIATGSIVSVLNIGYSMNIIIPFFFGGDGATFIVPITIVNKVMQALAQYKSNTLNSYNLELRTGIVAVKEIYDNGHHLRIAKFSSSASFVIPVLLGNGLNFAEKMIKGENFIFPDHVAQQTELDLSGMQCRWDRIPPPQDTDEVVTLLVIAREGTPQKEAFAKVINKIDELYGSPQKRQPISIAKLKFRTSFNAIGAEMRARIGKIKPLELIKTWMINLYGFIFFRTKKGKAYLESLVAMSDTLVIDGKINTVISGTKKQRVALQTALDQMEGAGKIAYGLHVSTASVMSCYVRDLVDDHIHFVDGSEGGYTQAAVMLKGKL